MKAKYYIFLLILFSALIGCKETILHPVEYIKWVENTENGLCIEKELNNYYFRLQYKPSNYVVLRELGLEKSYDGNLFNKRKAELDSFYYFNLDISSADKSQSILSNQLKNNEEYYARLNYFTSFAQSDIKLISSDDTIACALYHFERTYDLSPFNTIVIGFKQPKGKDFLKHDLQILFDDQILSVGQINFLIDRKKLKKVPKLAL